MHKEEFLTLCINFKNVDKQNFIESMYYLDKANYHPKTGVKLTSVGSGKRSLEARSSCCIVVM